MVGTDMDSSGFICNRGVFKVGDIGTRSPAWAPKAPSGPLSTLHGSKEAPSIHEGALIASLWLLRPH